jgi:sigma-E factor negative regulatory protein RseC
MKNDVVKHSGVIQQIDGNFLQVKIVQTTACSSCSIKSHCTSSESKEHLIKVYDKEAPYYHVGDEVWVIGSTSMSRKAVWYGYLLPLLILMALIIGLSTWWGKDHELSVALYSLACVVIYYFLLYYFGKDKLKKTFSFTVQPMN